MDLVDCQVCNGILRGTGPSSELVGKWRQRADSPCAVEPLWAIVRDWDGDIDRRIHEYGGQGAYGVGRRVDQVTRKDHHRVIVVVRFREVSQCGDDPAERSIAGKPIDAVRKSQTVEPTSVASHHGHRTRSGDGQCVCGSGDHFDSIDGHKRLVAAHSAAGTARQNGTGEVHDVGGQSGSSWRRKIAQRSSSSVSPINAAISCKPLRARRKP